MPLHFLHIENFASERQDGLGVAVASLLGRAACGVTLDEEYLAVFRVLVGAVGELAGQSASTHDALALHALTRLAGRDACGGGQDDLLTDELGLVGMLLKVVGQCLAHGRVDGARDLAVAELGLGLALKLRLGHLDGDDGGEALAEVLAGDLNLRFLNLF